MELREVVVLGGGVVGLTTALSVLREQRLHCKAGPSGLGNEALVAVGKVFLFVVS